MGCLQAERLPQLLGVEYRLAAGDFECTQEGAHVLLQLLIAANEDREAQRRRCMVDVERRTIRGNFLVVDAHLKLTNKRVVAY